MCNLEVYLYPKCLLFVQFRTSVVIPPSQFPLRLPWQLHPPTPPCQTGCMCPQGSPMEMWNPLSRLHHWPISWCSWRTTLLQWVLMFGACALAIDGILWVVQLTNCLCFRSQTQSLDTTSTELVLKHQIQECESEQCSPRKPLGGGAKWMLLMPS